MKRVIVFVLGITLLGALQVIAAPSSVSNNVSNTRIVQATKDTTVTYGGIKIFIPAGQTLILGQDNKGNVVVRGQNVSGVKIGQGTIEAQGPIVLSVQPKTQVIMVYRGESVRVTNGQHTAVISKGESVSAKHVRVVSSQQAEVASVSFEGVSTEETIPAFVAQTASSQAASEQATQDVEETVLSPSAPRY